MQFLKSTKYIKIPKKIRTKKIKNTKYKIHQKTYGPFFKIQNTKENTKPKFQKYKIPKKYEFKNEPESQPHAHFEKQEPNCKINAKPACCIF
jgi:hypothetical protein